MIKDEYCLVWEDSLTGRECRILKNGTAWYPAEGSETMNFSFIQRNGKRVCGGRKTPDHCTETGA